MKQLRHVNCVVGIVLGACLALAACDLPARTAPPLPELHGAGLHKVPGIDALLHGNPSDQKTDIPFMTAYAPSGSGRASRLLLIVGGVTYDIGIDGSSPRQLHLQWPCVGRASVSRDGRWLLCPTQQGITISDLTQLTDPGHLILRNADIANLQYGDQLWDPTWAPDGDHFAVSSVLGDVCSIALFTSEAPHLEAHLRASLLLADFTGHHSDQERPNCGVYNLMWSPDGQRLAMTSSPETLYILDLKHLQMSPVLSSSRVVSIPISRDELVNLGEVFNSKYVWHAGGDALLAPSPRFSIELIPLGGAARADFLPPQGSYLCSLSWTEQVLVFVQCAPSSEPSYVAPQAQIYTYTPQ